MDTTTIGGRRVFIYDSGSPEILLIQPVDDHDIAVLDSEFAQIERLSGGKCFRLAAFKIDYWNSDLSPWEAPPVFGNEPFGNGAQDTLTYVTDILIPELLRCMITPVPEPTEDAKNTMPELKQCADIPVCIGGYSLAGFFALWACYQTDAFAGVNAGSPSVWFPGWIEYAETHSPMSPLIYLSLGDKEEKARNPVMRTVGDCIRKQHELLQNDTACRETIFEINPGNHFKEPDIRTAKGFAWLISRL